MKEFHKVFRLFLPVLLVGISQCLFINSAFSQVDSNYTASKARLLKTLNSSFIDKEFSERINHFYSSSCDSLIQMNTDVDSRPIKIVLTRLFDATEQKINSREITLLRIPSVNSCFLLTLKNYRKQPIRNLYREIGITQTQILASAFDGLPIGDSIATFAGMREMRKTPYYISTRLQEPRYAPYRDSLIYFLANTAPKILADKLASNDPVFTAQVERNNHPTVKAIAQLKKDDYYDKILPFALAIQENRTTVEDVKKLTLTPQDYYEAFTAEVIRLYTSTVPEEKAFLARPVIDLNVWLATNYFINEINMLHEQPEKSRFEVLNTVSARQLYFILVGGSGELYTSSFLYLYKKFLKEADAGGLDKFFEGINYYQFRQFLANISNYGLVSDFVDHMQEEKFARLAGNYLGSLQNTQLTDDEIIVDAMTASGVLDDLRDHLCVKDSLLARLDVLEKPKAQNDIMLQRMYSGLKDILLDKNNYKTNSTYDVLPVKKLQRPNGIVQVHLFYDDDDATASFNHCLASYDADTWEKKDMGNYIVFNSKHGNKMLVYMNKPMTNQGYDSSQDEMLHAIDHDGLEITSFIHRGHSYYLAASLKKIKPSCQFVFLGACGGYNEVFNVFELNPDMNIIATRNIGSMLINDPLLSKINADLVNNRDIVWDDAWQDLNAKFQTKSTKDLFSSYIPPNKYIGIKFIRKVFNF